MEKAPSYHLSEPFQIYPLNSNCDERHHQVVLNTATHGGQLSICVFRIFLTKTSGKLPIFCSILAKNALKQHTLLSLYTLLQENCKDRSK
jgi:hypothetical protein